MEPNCGRRKVGTVTVGVAEDDGRPPLDEEFPPPPPLPPPDDGWLPMIELFQFFLFLLQCGLKGMVLGQ